MSSGRFYGRLANLPIAPQACSAVQSRLKADLAGILYGRRGRTRPHGHKPTMRLLSTVTLTFHKPTGSTLSYPVNHYKPIESISDIYSIKVY